MGMGNSLIPDYPEDPREMADWEDDSDFWAYVQDMERMAEEAEEIERSKADAYLDAERDLELMRQAGAL